MSDSKWIEHYRAGAWTVGEVIEAGAAWIVAMDPDHYRLRFFPHRDAARAEETEALVKNKEEV